MATELLEQLRNHQSDIFRVIADSYYARAKSVIAGRNYSRAMDLLIEHREEFPIKIKKKIDELDRRGERPYWFFREVESACNELFTAAEREGQPWRGLDSKTDTQEQVEVAVRFFPNVLNEWREGEENLWHSSFWVSACQRSLPFAPLLVVLAFELEEFLGRFNRRWHFAREFLLDNYSPAHVDDDHDKRFDELTLSTFEQLIAKNLIQKGSDEVFNFCWAAIGLRPARIERTLLHLIRWDETILNDSHRMGTGGLRGCDTGVPLLWHCWHICDGIGMEATRQRFRMIFERAIARYPHDLGFLFKNKHQSLRGYSCIYSMLTHYLGTDEVRNIVLDVIGRKAIRSFDSRDDIATEPIVCIDIDLEGMPQNVAENVDIQNMSLPFADLDTESWVNTVDFDSTEMLQAFEGMLKNLEELGHMDDSLREKFEAWAKNKLKITLSTNDVIKNQNAIYREHAGNKRLKLLIQNDADEYFHKGTTKTRKKAIAENIVNIITQENGRFLRVRKEVEGRPITDFEYEEIHCPEEKMDLVMSRLKITLSTNDVIKDQSRIFGHHTGNKRLKLLIQNDADEYFHEGTTKTRKGAIAKNIVNIIEENGRFLRVRKKVNGRPITDFEYEEIHSLGEKTNLVTSRIRDTKKVRGTKKKGKNRKRNRTSSMA